MKCRPCLLCLALAAGLLSPAFGQAVPRTLQTSISVSDYADLSVSEALIKLEKACNAIELEIEPMQIEVKGKIAYQGTISDLYETVPKQPIGAFELLMRIRQKAQLKQENQGPVITIRPMTQAEIEQEKHRKQLSHLLDGVVLERLDFQETPAKAVLAYLERNYTKRSSDEKQLKFRLIGDEPKATCTLDLENVPINEAVRYVTGLCNLQYRVDTDTRTVNFKIKE